MAESDMGAIAKGVRTTPGYGLAALVLGILIARGHEFDEMTMMMLTIGTSWVANRFLLPLYDVLYMKLNKDT